MPTVKPLLVALSLALLLGGCERNLNNQRVANFAPAAPVDLIRAVPSALIVDLKTVGGSLDRASLADLNTLLARQGRVSQQTVTLRPSTPAGEQVATRLAEVLRQVGVRQVITAPTELRSGNSSDLQVISEALVAQIPDCSIHNPSGYTVMPFKSVGTLGCANRANIANMVSDPRDLNRALILDGGDGMAAAAAVDRYQRHDTVELLDIDFNED